MAQQYAYNYAEIEDGTGLCLGVISTSSPNHAGPTGLGTTYIPVPVCDEEMIFKYYINGAWYEDAEGTIPWTSSLL